jgi:hypothetical protein
LVQLLGKRLTAGAGLQVFPQAFRASVGQFAKYKGLQVLCTWAINVGHGTNPGFEKKALHDEIVRCYTRMHGL